MLLDRGRRVHVSEVRLRHPDCKKSMMLLSSPCSACRCSRISVISFATRVEGIPGPALQSSGLRDTEAHASKQVFEDGVPVETEERMCPSRRVLSQKQTSAVEGARCLLKRRPKLRPRLDCRKVQKWSRGEGRYRKV